MSNRKFQPTTKAEVIDRDVDGLQDLYGFVTAEEPDGDGNATRADTTFAYHKLVGRVLISLHRSSLTWLPKARPATSARGG
ncbi:MAG: hypothetical protein AAGA48_18590 [Myxococcota bacterium]